MYIYKYTYSVHSCIYVYIRACVCTYIIYTYRHVYVYISTYMYTYLHHDQASIVRKHHEKTIIHERQTQKIQMQYIAAQCTTVWHTAAHWHTVRKYSTLHNPATLCNTPACNGHTTERKTQRAHLWMHLLSSLEMLTPPNHICIYGCMTTNICIYVYV